MTPKRIDIIKPCDRGDLLHITPSICVLKRKFPEARVDIMLDSCNDRLCRHTPQLECMALITVDEVFAAAADSGSGLKPCRW
jgi:ADP-heptose:LPS heptosyltransferase